MGKFERKIRKQMKSEVEDFDVWFEKNQEKFPGFTNMSNEEIEQGSEIKVKKKKIWLVSSGFFLAVLCVMLCFIPLMSQDQTLTHFGDDAVYETVIEDSEQATIIQENPFLAKISYVSGKKLLKTEDDSLVFVILNGELETEADYYFVTLQIEYNSYYDFLSKSSYEELENQTEVKGFSIRYDLMGLDADELYLYRMSTEKDGQRIYWEIHCFEENIEQFIDLMFN